MKTAAPGDRYVKVELRGAAVELMKARDPEILMSGMAGCGKTQAALYKVHALCMMNPGTRALIVRKTHQSLTGSTLEVYKSKVAVDALEMRHVAWFGGSSGEPASFKYRNGSTILVGGLDKPAKFLSTEFDLILVDEAVQVTPDDLDILVTRLRNGVLPYQQLIMLTNPDSPYHHLKQRADAGRCRMLLGRHQDNPSYYQNGEWTFVGKNYLAGLAGLPTIKRQRYLEGKWVAAEGLVYDDWDPAVHCAEPFPTGYPPKELDRYIGVDFGTRNPFVALWAAVSPDGRLYVYKQLYQSGMMVEDMAKQMKEISDKDPGRPRLVICDHDLGDRMTLEKYFGYSTVAAKKDVKPGIEAVQARLRKDVTGFPSLFVCKDSLVKRDKTLGYHAACLEEEMATYVWDTRAQPGGGNLREAPVKVDDHACDALRYIVAQLDLVASPSFRSFSAGGLARRSAF